MELSIRLSLVVIDRSADVMRAVTCEASRDVATF